MRLLIDLDAIVYGAGFAADSQWHKEHGEGNEIVPLSFALHTTKNSLYGILDALPHDTFSSYLSGSTNFRNEIAKTKPYKGNRVNAKRPTRYNEIREYLTLVWGAEICEGIEADDKVGIESFENDDCIICSLDKDLEQLPGKHYNWRYKEQYTIDEFEGWYNLYTQALVGDVSDNIPGLAKVGPVTAKKILKGAITHKELYELTQKAYLERKYTQEYLEEQLNLLYLWRKMPDKWQPPMSQWETSK